MFKKIFLDDPSSVASCICLYFRKLCLSSQLYEHRYIAESWLRSIQFYAHVLNIICKLRGES